MPTLRLLVFLLFLYLFLAIPFLGKKEIKVGALATFNVLADDASYEFIK